MRVPVNIAQYIDHTYLMPDATSDRIKQLCDEAMQYSFYSVCVNSSFVPMCRELLSGSHVKITAVCGFPLGACAPEVKAYEAAWAVEQGADEIDMVMAIGRLVEGQHQAVKQDIARVAKIVESKAKVKVILETGLLTDDQVITACQISDEAGAHFVKTSTGFGPGGATIKHIQLMKEHVSDQVGVKASGGIRDYDTAVSMIQAGANRLGLSASVAIMHGLSHHSDY